MVQDTHESNRTMSNRWSDKKKWQATYGQWLKEDFHNMITVPIRGADEFKEMFHMFGFLLFWIFLMLTFPLTLPIITYIKMRKIKKGLIKTYTEEELNK